MDSTRKNMYICKQNPHNFFKNYLYYLSYGIQHFTFFSTGNEGIIWLKAIYNLCVCECVILIPCLYSKYSIFKVHFYNMNDSAKMKHVSFICNYFLVCLSEWPLPLYRFIYHLRFRFVILVIILTTLPSPLCLLFPFRLMYPFYWIFFSKYWVFVYNSITHLRWDRGFSTDDIYRNIAYNGKLFF